MKPGFHTTSALWYILKLPFLAKWVHYGTIFLIFFSNGRRLEFYCPIDPKIIPMCVLDMEYPTAKFDVDWLQENQVIT